MKTLNTIKRTLVIIVLMTLFGTGLIFLFSEPDSRVALDTLDFIVLKTLSAALLYISYNGFKDMKVI